MSTKLFHLTPTLAARLGSIVRHVEEGASADGHQFDFEAAKALVNDPEVQSWMAAMDKYHLLPVRRNG